MTSNFRTSLLGKPSHDALIKLQEYEIKLLEVMKKTLSARIKCGKEYANSLNQLANVSQKLEPPYYDSNVYQAWREIVREISQTSQLIKKNMETLQTSTFDKLATLIKDKNTVKKTYVDNRERVDNQLLKVMHTELDKKRNAYVKMENDTSKSHHECDQLSNKKGAKQLSIEKAQDKYRKNTMKLHNYHNDYVLQVEEANMHQKHYSKDIVVDFLHYTSPCTEEFVAFHADAEAKVQEIDANVEYDRFVDQHRCNLEAEANIQFDNLNGEGANLPGGQILLNSLSLQGIEHLINGYQEDLEVIQSQVDHHNQCLNELDEEIRQFVENKESLSLLMKQQEYMSTKLELTEKENLNLRHQQLCYLLNQSLQELGENDPPPVILFSDKDTASLASSSSIPDKKEQGPTFFNKLSKFVKAKVNETTKPYSPFNPSKDIREQVWFHGSIPREEVKNLLLEEGSFLLRESVNNPGDFVLCANADGQIRHFKLYQNELGKYKFEGEAFSTIFELIHYHYKQKVPIKNNPPCVLGNPICKDKWQLTHDDIEICDKLGAGNFGEVYRGYMRSLGQYVAVKTCKDNVDSRTKDKFLLEAKILKGYDHPNIVKLIGVCTDRQPIYIVLELVSGGDLSDYVKAQKASLMTRHLIQLCKDACAGLGYLEQKNCIHRDVAARNCLVTETGVVKITDFGMSREEEDGIYTVSGTMKSIPMRWTAPEAMDYGKFTSASDVWSFGILSWEIFSFGERPYPNMTNVQARDQVGMGYRMPKQSNCPDRYYNEVMRLCWLEDPDRRPRFAELLRTIDSILKTV